MAAFYYQYRNQILFSVMAGLLVSRRSYARFIGVFDHSKSLFNQRHHVTGCQYSVGLRRTV